MPLEELFAGEPSPLRVLGVVKAEGFKVGDRAAHVYAEADRVYAFRAAAEVGSARGLRDKGVVWEEKGRGRKVGRGGAGRGRKSPANGPVPAANTATPSVHPCT